MIKELPQHGDEWMYEIHKNNEEELSMTIDNVKLFFQCIYDNDGEVGRTITDVVLDTLPPWLPAERVRARSAQPLPKCCLYSTPWAQEQPLDRV